MTLNGVTTADARYLCSRLAELLVSHAVTTLAYYSNDVVLRSLLHQKAMHRRCCQSLSRPKHELKLYIWDTFVSQTMCHGH